MEFLSTILLGILEGITEFIPVSSTGHLILLGSFLGQVGASANTFMIFIQLGAILAAAIVYLEKFCALLNFSKCNGTPEFKGWFGIRRIFIACLPAFLLGYLCHDYIKAWLFNPLSVAVALLLVGVLMLFIDGKDKPDQTMGLEQINLRQSFIIGLCQCVSLWPGVSRSGSTIIGGLIAGLDRKTSADFSFIIAVPVMMVAVLYDLKKSYSILSTQDLPHFALGFIVAFASALLAIRFFLNILKKYTLRPFGYYRIILGLLVIALYL